VRKKRTRNKKKERPGLRNPIWGQKGPAEEGARGTGETGANVDNLKFWWGDELKRKPKRRLPDIGRREELPPKGGKVEMMHKEVTQGYPILRRETAPSRRETRGTPEDENPPNQKWGT